MKFYKKQPYNNDGLEINYHNDRPKEFSIKDAIENVDESRGIESQLYFIKELVTEMMESLPPNVVLNILNKRAYGEFILKE